MLFKKNETMPQFSDRFLRIVAFAILMMSISYASAAAAHFVGEDVYDVLHTVRAIFGLGAAGIVIIPFLQLMWIRFKNKPACKNETEGFIADVYAKSTINAFSAGFIGLIFLEPFAAKVIPELPPAFFVQTALSLMMAVLGINFFIKSRADDDELADDFDDEFEHKAGPK